MDNHKIVNNDEAKHNIEAMLNDVVDNGAAYNITQKGTTVAVVIPFDEYLDLMKPHTHVIERCVHGRIISEYNEDIPSEKIIELPCFWVENHEHICRTSNGVEIKLGLKVIDYDRRQGVVVAEPDVYDMRDPECWPIAGHNGHWWSVCPDREGHTHIFEGTNRCRGASFDGSRMTTRGVK